LPPTSNDFRDMFRVPGFRNQWSVSVSGVALEVKLGGVGRPGREIDEWRDQ